MDSSTKETLLDSSATNFSLLNAMATTAIVVVLYAFWKEARSEAILKRVNLPGPKPWPFFGNLLEVRKFNGIHLMLHDYLQTYGKVFSLTVGRKPAIVIADPDFLKQILVKDFWNFRNRFMQLKPTGPAAKGIFIARDEEWKRIRTTLSPSFSAKKMKGMVSLMDESMKRVMEKIDPVADTGKSVNMLDVFGRMTLEVILSTAFGFQADIQNDEESVLFKRVKDVFRVPWIVGIMRQFPFGSYILRILAKLRRQGSYFEKVASDMVHRRRKSGKLGREDLMHLMLTAHEQFNGDDVSKLTDEEIIGQCLIFLLAGYETSSNTLGYITYYLALNQEVQDKLREEITSAVKTNPDSTLYDLAHSIEYLDCVINETLRLNPPLAQLSRECVEDYDFKGIRIPAGFEVTVPVYSLHRDPVAWSDPERFDPERFLSPAKDNRHPYQFMPFGLGPRACIGMRFALMEIKITLVKFLLKYKVVRSPETQVPLKIVAGVTLIAKDGVHVQIEKL